MPASRIMPAVLVFLACGRPIVAQQNLPLRTMEEPQQRGASMQRELDDNRNAVRDLYTLLDATSPTQHDARQYLETQIQRFDDRSAVLFREMEAVEADPPARRPHVEGRVEASRLVDEARQLRRAGYWTPAALLEARAKVLLRELRDQTNASAVDHEWLDDHASPRSRETDIVAALQELRGETRKLRSDIQQLRERVAELTAQLTASRQP